MDTNTGSSILFVDPEPSSRRVGRPAARSPCYAIHMSRPFVRVLGVALAVSACEKQVEPKAISNNPPAPGEVPGPPPAEAPLADGDAPASPDRVAEPPTIPEAEDGTERPILRNPPPPLPEWDAVGSGHPEGATNPPSPVLIVARESGLCYKAWMGGMIPWPPAIAQAGGKVVATDLDVGNATRIHCPPGQPNTLLAAWDALPEEVRDALGPRPGTRR